jgi:TolA-binding protein
MYEKGWALQNLGRDDDALATYEQVIAKTDRESAARAQFMIGEIQFASKKYREAIVSFFKVIAAYGYPKWQADASYEAGRCFEELGYKQKAIEQYEELIKSFPKSDRVEAAQTRLAELRG